MVWMLLAQQAGEDGERERRGGFKVSMRPDKPIWASSERGHRPSHPRWSYFTVGVAAAVRRVKGPDAAWKRLAHVRADNLALVKDVDFGHLSCGSAVRRR